jgi:hypothetical protein
LENLWRSNTSLVESHPSEAKWQIESNLAVTVLKNFFFKERKKGYITMRNEHETNLGKIEKKRKRR